MVSVLELNLFFHHAILYRFNRHTKKMRKTKEVLGTRLQVHIVHDST